jgi:signal transduction histidine kinase
MDMQVNGKDFLLEIVDNGRGIPSADHRPAGNGLEKIDERARKLHAEVTYRAVIDGKGTLWQCRIPLSSLSSSTIASNTLS